MSIISQPRDGKDTSRFPVADIFFFFLGGGGAWNIIFSLYGTLFWLPWEPIFKYFQCKIIISERPLYHYHGIRVKTEISLVNGKQSLWSNAVMVRGTYGPLPSHYGPLQLWSSTNIISHILNYSVVDGVVNHNSTLGEPLKTTKVDHK